MRVVRVAVLDSGVHPKHPHVPTVTAGFNATAAGMAADWFDRLGHGTAVAAAIVDHAPEVEILAVKIFDVALRTNLDTLLRGIDWALEQGVDILNLSLGSTKAEYGEALSERVRRGGMWVSALANDGVASFPGALAGVVAVEADAGLERHEYRRLGPRRYAASPYPREIPGVPRERNLHGVSFAVANVTGLLAAGKINLACGLEEA
jgi:hypothetical protein